MDEMRRDGAGQEAPLMVRFANEPHVTEPQVAEAAVHELRRRARRPRAEVPRVDQRDRQALASRVCGGRRPDHATADHEQVEGRPLERLERCGPALVRDDGRWADHRGFARVAVSVCDAARSRTPGDLQGESTE